MAGSNPTQLALGMGGNVTIVDRHVERLRDLDPTSHGRLSTLAATRGAIAEAVVDAVLVIGAVLVPGAKAPTLDTRALIASMRPGSVVVNVESDQGGWIETARRTTHREPTLPVDGAIQYGMTNGPGGDTAQEHPLAGRRLGARRIGAGRPGVWQATARESALERGINVAEGKVTHPAVATGLGVDDSPMEEVRHQEEPIAVWSTRKPAGSAADHPAG